MIPLARRLQQVAAVASVAMQRDIGVLSGMTGLAQEGSA
jgi:hypothetical protein